MYIIMWLTQGAIKLNALNSSKRGVLSQNASYVYNLLRLLIIHDVGLGTS